ncbi:MAG: response regulator [Verrucomicrobiales bacterium]|nr:response regulator [Verrucomicrobiales bacterium]
MKKKSILIIDDEASFARMTKIFLEGKGDYDVSYETESMKAVETTRSTNPDLILLDLVMPELDGGDVLARFNDDPVLKSIPVLFVTSMVSQDDTSDDSLVQSGDNIMIPKTSPPEFVHQCIQDKLAGVI